MAVDGITSRAGVLAGHATRLRAFLEEARLVDDEHAARFVPEVLDEIIPQPAQRAPGAYRVGVPGGGIQQALDTFSAALTDLLSQLPAIFAFDVVEQAGQVTSGGVGASR
jgi:hypothetical protein